MTNRSVGVNKNVLETHWCEGIIVSSHFHNETGNWNNGKMKTKDKETNQGYVSLGHR